MRVSDLWLLWEWSYDAPFVRLLENVARQTGTGFQAIAIDGLPAACQQLDKNAAMPRLVVDRASDISPVAASICRLAKQRGVKVVNDPDRMAPAGNKATMHLALMSVGVHVPWTILLPPETDALSANEPPQPRSDLLRDLPQIGLPFVIKPAHGAGGEGVVLAATSPRDIEQARSQRADDTVLVQQRIAAAIVDEQLAYFRMLHCLDEVYPCFWHPQTRRYTPLTEKQNQSAWGQQLTQVVRSIAKVAQMSLFSTELALTDDGTTVAVDYVNDMCDLRPASQYPDGVPDAILEQIARQVIRATRNAGEASGR